MKRLFLLTLVVMVALLGSACGGESASGRGQAKGEVQKMSAAEAQKLMESESGYLIVDVRTPQEYAAGHVQKAINIPNETISTTPPAALSDKGQRIFLYCRSGRRSQDAAQKLAAMGYTNLVDFGAITDWRGALAKD